MVTFAISGRLRDAGATPAAGARHGGLLRDGVSYRLAGLWLDDAEYAELLR